MIKVTFFVMVTFLSLTTANSYYNYPHSNYNKDYFLKAPAHYNFGYAVKDGYYNDYGHQEQRVGDKTMGNYYVHLPNGNRQMVNYFVDGYSGYSADVNYYGHPFYKPYNYHL